MTEVLALNEIEKEGLYTIFLEKEIKMTALRNEYKKTRDKEAFRVEIKKINPVYNQKIRGVIKKEKMLNYFEYLKAKRKKN